METPSCMTRVTRFRSSTSTLKSKQEGTHSRPRTGGGGNPDRSVLLDITNDSPIIGLAAGVGILAEKTPSSTSAKSSSRGRSGEALLRSQVRTLLQRVEEEEGEPANKKLPVACVPPFCQRPGLSRSPPMLMLTPTPVNTPMLVDDQALCLQVEVVSALKQTEEPQECTLNRALLFDDSPGKSEASDGRLVISSSKTYQGSESKSSEDDSSSAWSVLVNASSTPEEDCDEEEEEEEECFDELCEGMRKMAMVDGGNADGLLAFQGKHTRFVYNSDGEMEGEEEVGVVVAASPSVVVLKGLPVPEGKHLRFPEEEDGED